MSKAKPGKRTPFVAKVALGLMVAASAVVPTTSADASIDQFVDCSDSFWAVTCGVANVEPVVEQTVQIDNDAVCTPAANDMVICHT